MRIFAAIFALICAALPPVMRAEESAQDAAAAAVRSLESAKSQSGEIMTTQGLLSWLISTLAVLAVIFVAAYLLKKTRFVRLHGGTMTLKSQLALGPKERVVEIEIYGRHLLLGVASGQVSYLCEVEPGQSGEDETAKRRQFASLMGRNKARGSEVPKDEEVGP